MKHKSDLILISTLFLTDFILTISTLVCLFVFPFTWGLLTVLVIAMVLSLLSALLGLIVTSRFISDNRLDRRFDRWKSQMGRRFYRWRHHHFRF